MPGPEPVDQAATATGMHAGADLAPGTMLAGRFLIEKLLGIGGMGVVYRARDLALDVTVALKLLRPELASRPESFDRFRQELLLARQVSSPNVVRIHDIARHEGRWFISMDYVDGEPLDQVLDRRGQLPVEESLAIARQLAEGLGAAHASGIVHRDLKPSNVLIDQSGRALISDFGIARSLGSTGLTASGAVVGTPDYLSPEQARAGAIDGRSDLYALGLILYEMLSGKLPFGGGTPAESLSQRMLHAPKPLSTHRKDLPAWVVRLVDRLLRPNPAHRLPDAAAVVAVIDRRALSRDLRPGRRSLAVATAVLAVAAGLAWWSQRPVPVVSALPVPDRVVVLVENGGGGADPVLEAVAEHLRLGLGRLPGVQVVDGERTQLAQAQAGFSPGSDISDAALLDVLPARRVLRLSRAQGDGEPRYSARLGQAGTPDSLLIEGVAPDALAQGIARSLADAAFPDGVLPADAASLADYGQALQLQRAGRAEAAMTAFASLARGQPDYAAAWLGLMHNARTAGQRHIALDAARAGAALGNSALAPEFQRWLDLLEMRVDAALAAQRSLTAARPDDLDAWLAQGDMELRGDQYEAAVASLESVVARDQDDPRAWFLLGKAAILQGEPREAVENHLVRALVLYKRGRSTFGEAETTNALGVGYARLGQTADADEQYRKALALRRELDDRRGMASSLRNIAQLAIIHGRFDEAQASLDEARGLFAAIGDSAGGADVDNELGLLAEERGDYAAALDAYRRALRGREGTGNDQGVAESLNNIGFAHYQLGDYDNALAFWRQARGAFEALEDHNGIVRTEQNLGLLEIARGAWTEARARLDASLRSAESRHMHEEAAVSRRNLAELELLGSRLGDAQAHLRQARALFTEREDQRGLMDADLLEARLLLAADALPAAAALLDRIQPRLAASSPEQRAIAALLRASLQRAGGDEAGALASLALAREQGLSVRVLQLQSQALALARSDAPEAATLDAEIARLGNLPLQLQWLERSLELRLAEGANADAVATYRAAGELLVGHGEYVRARQLHRLGAAALAAQGDAAGADAANRAAARSQDLLQAGLPAELAKPSPPAPRGAPDVPQS